MRILRIEKLLSRLLAIPDLLFVSFGLALLTGTVLAAAVVNDKQLAVAVAVCGTFLGTVLLSLFLPKLAYRSIKDQMAIEEQVVESKRKNQESERQLLEAEREIARLESMQIHLEALQPIVTLGLLKVNTTLTDFKLQWLDEPVKPTWRMPRQDAYVGAVRIPVSAQLGVDLQQVQISEHDSDGLIVSGLGMTTVADTADGADWLLDEVVTVYSKDGNPVQFDGTASNPRSKALSREHEHEVRSRLKAGQDFQVFEPGLIRAAEHVLCALLAPLGKKLTFHSTSNGQGKNLLNYLAEHNRGLKSRIEELRNGESSSALSDGSSCATDL